MNQMINVNYISRGCHHFKKALQAQGKLNSPADFMESIAKKKAENEKKENEIQKTEQSSSSSNTQDMSMEEYKQYIHDMIFSFPMSATKEMESIHIYISEEGFEAMREDPEYEKWVLNDLRTLFLQTDSWVSFHGGATSVIYYGATKEECRYESWYSGNQNKNKGNPLNGKNKDGYWDRRIEQKKKIAEEYKAFQEKKAIAKQWQKKQEYTEFILKKGNKKHIPMVYPVYDIKALLNMIGANK